MIHNSAGWVYITYALELSQTQPEIALVTFSHYYFLGVFLKTLDSN